MESRQGRGEAIDKWWSPVRDVEGIDKRWSPVRDVEGIGKRWSPVRDVEGIGRDAVRRSRTESLCKIGFTYTI